MIQKVKFLLKPYNFLEEYIDLKLLYIVYKERRIWFKLKHYKSRDDYLLRMIRNNCEDCMLVVVCEAAKQQFPSQIVSLRTSRLQFLRHACKDPLIVYHSKTRDVRFHFTLALW